MPKKFTSENSKVVEARARKADAKQAEHDRVEKAKEDAKWADDDKSALKKQQRKDDQERKRQELADKKAEKAKLYEEEMNATTATTTTKVASSKVTRAQIETQKEEERREREKKAETKRLSAQNILIQEELLAENLNRIALDDSSARNVDEAIALLDEEKPVADEHPEKRMRAAYTAFEARRLPELKEQKPTFRLSQLKQLLKKEWQKSTENPLNERLQRIL